jgi:hypothetical protein
LEGNALWSQDHQESALSHEALTTVMMGRYFVIERVRRALGSDLGRVRPKVAAAGLVDGGLRAAASARSEGVPNWPEKVHRNEDGTNVPF